jgi:hypothetical protein
LKSAEQLEEMDDGEITKYKAKLAKYKAFDEAEAKSILASAGAKDVKSVEARGWFE